ncbi:MAG: hypothetical protein PVJ72_14740 [Gammaproteobacteria bacterium]|jgi:hypothetical protein
MSLDQQAEEILLESNEDLVSEPSEETFNKVTAQLVQIQKWKRQSVGTQILDNKFLFVKRYQHGRSTSYWVNLLFANPVPQRVKRIDWRWGIAALILLANSAGFIAAEHYWNLSEKFIFFNSITVIFATLALISFLTMIYKSKNALVFHTLHGHLPILSLAINNPSKQAFQSYAKTLRQCIEAIQQKNAHKTKNQLANELAEHRRLKDSNVISQQEYEQAKNRILSQH